MSDNQDTLKSFGNDLYLVFSKDNMKEISRKLRDKRGYEFPQLLHDELYDLMVRYEISTKDAETYIHHFTQIIISYLEKAEISSCSIIDIDAQIRKESLYKGMSLDFFELDDEQFETKLQEKINDERILLLGNRERKQYTAY